MNKDLQTFNSPEFGTIRTATINNQPYFAGKDIASALGYTNPQKAIRDHVDPDDQTVNKSFTVHGTPVLLINESGLYSLILTSKLPSAREFKRWVTCSVLPMIRSTGIYAPLDGDTVVPTRVLTPEDYIAAARLIASCKNDRLRIVLHLLAKGGWDIPKVTQSLVTSTSDIQERIKETIEATGMTLADLSERTKISTAVLRSYREGRRFPRPERYEALVAALNETVSEYEEAVEG